MELLCVTGVEDQLQADVRPTLELLRNAGIKVQPLTDKNLYFTQDYKATEMFLCSGGIFLFTFISLTYMTDLDVDRRQARDCYMHS